MPEETHDDVTQNQTENHEVENGSTDVSGLSPEQLREELSKVRREAAARRIENKTYKEKAEKWEEHERNQMSEIDKLKADLAKRDSQLSELQVERLKISVAREVGLDVEDAELLSGSDEATIRAYAEKLKSRLAPKQENGKQTPADLLAGRRGQPIGKETDKFSMDELIRNSARRL